MKKTHETMTIFPDARDLPLDELKARYHRYLGRLTSAAMAEKVRRGEYAGCAPTGYMNLREGDETFVRSTLS